eukprot:3665833-Pyramimonas_sp.AAC.1
MNTRRVDTGQAGAHITDISVRGKEKIVHHIAQSSTGGAHPDEHGREYRGQRIAVERVANQLCNLVVGPLLRRVAVADEPHEMAVRDQTE